MQRFPERITFSCSQDFRKELDCFFNRYPFSKSEIIRDLLELAIETIKKNNQQDENNEG